MSSLRKRGGVSWRFEDLVAFECALARDKDVDWASLKKQDAAVNLDESVMERGDPREIALGWLQDRLRREPEIRLAADSVTHSLKVAGQLLGAGGLLLGLAAATAALAYTGAEPINVSAFFSLFILLQALLAVGVLLLFLMPAAWREALAFGPLFRVVRWLLEGLFSKLQGLSARFLSGQQRQDAAEWAGAARRSLALHGRVAKWIAFVKIQAAALCFSSGALAALLLAVAFSDRAFGWQTTLDVSVDAIHDLAKAAAIPWSWWLGEGAGFPSQQQIAGSRIVLKDGIRGLGSENLAAWWQFLALGIVAYGMLPRVLFYFLGKWQVRSALAAYDFRSAAAQRLMERLRPVAGRFEAQQVEQGAAAAEGLLQASDREQSAGQSTRCLYSAELEEAFDLEALRSCLAQRWRLPEGLVELRPYRNGKVSEGVLGMAEDAQVALVFESWMPPIREIERQVRELRQSVDERCLIKLVLLGIPDSEEAAISLRPDERYAKAWDSFARRLGDPYLVLDNSIA